MSHASMTAEARHAAGITGSNVRVSTGIETPTTWSPTWRKH